MEIINSNILKDFELFKQEITFIVKNSNEKFDSIEKKLTKIINLLKQYNDEQVAILLTIKKGG